MLAVFRPKLAEAVEDDNKQAKSGPSSSPRRGLVEGWLGWWGLWLDSKVKSHLNKSKLLWNCVCPVEPQSPDSKISICTKSGVSTDSRKSALHAFDTLLCAD